MRERLETVDKVRIVDIDDGDEQDELGEGERHAVDVVREDAGQRPAEHVSHAYVEQRNEEGNRDDEAGAHGRGGGLQLLVGDSIWAAPDLACTLPFEPAASVPVLTGEAE